jgi:ABC-type glycerol-3-phosphate transport system permease component
MGEAGVMIEALDRFLRPWHLTVRQVPIWLAGLVVSLLWAAPFIWMASTSLKPASQVMTKDIEWLPRTVVLTNYLKVFEYPVLRWALNSVIVSSSSTALCVLSGAMAGYALARLRFPGRDLIFAIFLLSLMVPTEVYVVPLLLAIIKIGWASSYQALILPTVANVFSVYIFRQFFLSFPRELEEAAIADGAGYWLIFWRIALPLAKAPAIAATVIVFTLNWNNFLWPLLVTFDDDMKTLPVGIAAFAPVVGTHTQLEGFAVAMAAATLLSLPSLLLFFVTQRYFVQGIASSGLRG